MIWICHLFFFSPQNGWGWKWFKVISCNPLLRQGCLKQAAQNYVLTGFEYIWGWRVCYIFGQSVPVLGYHQRKEVFPDVQMMTLAFQFVPSVSCPGTGHHWKELGSIFFAPFLQVSRYICIYVTCIYIHICMKFSQAFSSPGSQSQLS